MDLVETVIKTFGPKKILADEDKFKKSIELKRKEVKYKMPNIRFKSRVSKVEFNNFNVLHFSNGESDKVIIYLHGGAYVSEAGLFHYKFVDKIAKESNVDIYFPIYPLTPNYTYKETYELLLVLYKKLLDSNKEIIFIGDSAGGGLALAFTQYLNELKIKTPSKLILVSPWVDVSMSNPDIEKYEEMDVMLSSYGLLESGRLWAGELDLKDYKVSPIYGDLTNIPEVVLFVGTEELLYPDICLLHDKLKENGVNSKLIIGKNMGHDYPLYPVSEGIKARDEIIKILNK